MRKAYDDITQAIKEGNIEAQKSNIEHVKKYRAQIQEAIKTLNELRESGLDKNDNLIKDQINEVEYFTNLIEGFGFTVDDATGKINELTTAESNIANQETIDRIKANAEAERKRIENTVELIDRYNYLNNIENKSATQKKEMSILAQQLGSRIKELNIVENENSKSIIKNVDMLEDKKKALNETKNAIKTEAEAMIESQEKQIKILVKNEEMTLEYARTKLETSKAIIEAYEKEAIASANSGYFFQYGN